MGISSRDCDFSGWATRANMKCSDGRTIMKDAFIDCDGSTVPLVWNHQHNEPFNVLGHALLENKDEGVYAYCKFNDSESGKMGREMVRNGDVNQLSIYANQLKQQGGNVIHGAIREVSLVLAGANPGAYIDSVMCHSDDSDEAGIIFTGEDIVLAHSEEKTAEEDSELVHAEDSKKADKNGEGVKKEEETKMAETKVEKKEEPGKEKTVQDVFDTLTEEQKTVVYALIGQALEDAGMSDEEDETEDEEEKSMKHSEGGNDTMYTNIFDRDSVQQVNVLSHADQEEIIKMAKAPGMTLKSAIEMYAADHKDTLAHGIDTINTLFPDYKDVYPGAPELLERDHDWVQQVLSKARKSPVSRVRTRQIDARAKDIRAKGYKNRESEKTVSANMKVLMRTTDPQTVYFRDALHRDDINDITDFDVVAYQRNVMKRSLEEEIALAALVGDGRTDIDPDKISEDHIRPVWRDADLYTIKSLITVPSGGSEAEEFIDQSVRAMKDYKGSGSPTCFTTESMLTECLLLKDKNGRRIYKDANEVATAMRVSSIVTVPVMEGLTRTSGADTFNLKAIIVNLSDYNVGADKGGAINMFDDFDIDYNQQKYLIETRCSGALIKPFSAITLEMKVSAGA